MHIVIIGDSWGEPNWRGPHLPGFTAEGHTQHRLTLLGHTVSNYSQSGQSNLYSWRQFSRAQHDCDHIIWFHTEVVRDLEHGARGALKQLLDRTALSTYTEIEQIWRQQAPLTIIEAQSQGHQPYFDQIFAGADRIKDWRAELLGCESLPYTPLLAQISAGGEILAQFTDSDHDKAQWITDTEQVLDLMKWNYLFPDNCHPGDLAHAQLVQQLMQKFS